MKSYYAIARAVLRCRVEADKCENLVYLRESEYAIQDGRGRQKVIKYLTALEKLLAFAKNEDDVRLTRHIEAQERKREKRGRKLQMKYVCEFCQRRHGTEKELDNHRHFVHRRRLRSAIQIPWLWWIEAQTGKPCRRIRKQGPRSGPAQSRTEGQL